MILDTNHFSFTVSNLDQSIAFYQNALGLKLLNRSTRDVEFSQAVTGIQGASLDIAYFEAYNVRIELIQYLSPESHKIDTKTSNIGSSHICFNVDGLEKLASNFLSHGGTMNGAICEVPAGPNQGKKVVYLDDPDGNTIEFIGK